MAITLSSYEGELNGWPKSSWNRGVFEGERKLVCAYQDRVALLYQLDDPSNWAWPAEYGDGPWNGYSYFAQAEPLGNMRKEKTGDQAGLHYDKAVITVKYKSGYAIAYGNDLIQEKIEPTAEFKIVDPKSLYWSNNETNRLNVQEAPSKAMFGFDLVRTYRRVLVVPPWVQRYTGFCNSNEIISPVLGMVFPPETLMYKPPVMIEGASFAGLQAWDITTRLSYRGNFALGQPIGWNKHWRASTFSWENIYTSSGAIYRNIPAINMSALQH